MSLGTKIEEFFRRIGEAVLGVRNMPNKLKEAKSSLGQRAREPRENIPSFLEDFFHRRYAGWPEYVVLKVQICILLLFVAATIFAIFPKMAPKMIFIPLILILAGYAVYLVPTQLKRAFKRDYPAYRTFVVMVLSVVFVLIIVLRYSSFGALESPYMAILPVILVVGSVLLSFVAFRLKYGRDYTYGVVQGTKGSRAAVRISYDIRSNVKHGLYFLETLIDVEPSDRVRIGVDRSMWGFRGSEPTVILEKTK